MPSLITRRIDKLEHAVGNRRVVIIASEKPDKETPEEATHRHLSDHPEDSGAEFVVVYTGVPRSPGWPGW